MSRPNFVMAPFRCDNCGHELLIDGAYQTEADGRLELSPRQVLDWTRHEETTAGRRWPKQLELHTHAELVDDVRRLRAEVARLEKLAHLTIRLPWKRKRADGSMASTWKWWAGRT